MSVFSFISNCRNEDDERVNGPLLLIAINQGLLLYISSQFLIEVSFLHVRDIPINMSRRPA